MHVRGTSKYPLLIAMKKKSYLLIKVLLIAVAILIIAIIAYRLLTDAIFNMTTRLLIQELMDSSENYRTTDINFPETQPSTEQNTFDNEDEQTPDSNPKLDTNSGVQAPSNIKNQEQSKTLPETPAEIPGQNLIPEDLASRVSMEDKRRILQLVMRKLSADDINYLLGLLKGGLTAKEKKQAVELAYKRFTSEEIAEIKSYYKKYMQ